MKRLILSFMAAAMMWIVTPAHAQSMEDIGEGARIWADNCTRCHNGRSPMERTDRQWTTIVAHMRARANLTKTEARRVAGYLRMMNAPEVAAVPPAVPGVAAQQTGAADVVNERKESANTSKPKSSGSD